MSRKENGNKKKRTKCHQRSGMPLKSQFLAQKASMICKDLPLMIELSSFFKIAEL